MHAAATLHALPRRRSPRRDAARQLALLALALFALAATAGTGIGATSLSTTKTVTATVLASIALADPTALDTSPAPTAGTAWTDAATNLLVLGELQPTDVASASATWRVTTSNPTGYQVTLSNTGAAPLMRSSAGTMADMPDSPAALDTSKSHVGVAAGDAVGHAQGAVSFTGTPWGSAGAGGTQGTLYRGVPAAGMIVASRTSGELNDPVTLNFAATTAASQPVPPGAYAGTVRVTAATI